MSVFSGPVLKDRGVSLYFIFSLCAGFYNLSGQTVTEDSRLSSFLLPHSRTTQASKAAIVCTVELLQEVIGTHTAHRRSQDHVAENQAHACASQIPRLRRWLGIRSRQASTRERMMIAASE